MIVYIYKLLGNILQSHDVYLTFIYLADFYIERCFILSEARSAKSTFPENTDLNI
jgi:hypothetical protein